jgi:aspartate carbamoyltransferase catalytic subunit
MKIDCVVMRHPVPGSCIQLTNYVDSVIVNAGDGTHEHPTQALLDMMSIKEHFGKIKNLKIGIVGDILHSRVALSNIFGLVKLGAKVKVCGPPHLIQKDIEDLNVEVEYDVDNLIDWADAINVLRIQRERMGVGIIPSIREYRRFFGITSNRIKNHKKEIVIMHPGPINRGVEIDSSVADSDQSIILNQVLNGVAVRMSVLYLLLGSNDLKS